MFNQFWGCLQTVPSRGICKNFSVCYLTTKMSVAFLCHTLPAMMDRNLCQNKYFLPAGVLLRCLSQWWKVWLIHHEVSHSRCWVCLDARYEGGVKEMWARDRSTSNPGVNEIISSWLDTMEGGRRKGLREWLVSWRVIWNGNKIPNVWTGLRKAVINQWYQTLLKKLVNQGWRRELWFQYQMC